MALDYRPIMNGQRKDPLAVVMRPILALASIPYRMVVRHRNRRYDRGRLPVQSCGVPVISVGNLTTGGTGKTPIVCFLAKWLREQGLRVAIVSRGYGRGQADANDEALELHNRLPDVPHIQDPDRVAAARIAVEELESQVILMDDGFQHRRLQRDLNLVVIDATCPFGFGYLLPRGLLREPISSLRRADLVIVTRCDAVSQTDLAEIEGVIEQVTDSLPVVRSEHRPTSLLQHPGKHLAIELLAGAKVAVLCAIGNPEGFESTVRRCGATVVAAQHLPDHDPYAPETVNQIRQWIESLGGQIDRVVCTHKDLVKLNTDRLGGQPIAAILIELQLHSGAERLIELLREVRQRAPQQAP